MLDQKKEINRLLQSEGSLLVVLDACRHDSFAKVNWLDGRLQKAESPGSATQEWAMNCFDGEHSNIVYVSSIPWISGKYLPEVHHDYDASKHFFLVENVWDWGYDDAALTVLPETVAKVGLRVQESYPHKNVIAHFAQPHPPMIGAPPLTIEVWESLTGKKMDGCFPHIEDIVGRGYKEYLVKAYEGNLKLVLAEVKRLVANWSGRAVITADHGEGFGENGVFGHRAGIRTPELVVVPWFEVKQRDNLEWLTKRESNALRGESRVLV